ncbi:PHD finger protein 7-like [Struthio camelus]|uniref:PHD finger protein 7-like n=1 Tax=Struthio camelus TaxID=8801 RepID=UPI003603DA45
MEQLEDQLSFGTMVCPVCQGAWFHRACVQGQAFSAGRACFRCPQCQNKRKFLAEMLKMGIMVPFRLPTWEEDGHFDELYERHSRCDAGRCLYRRGREQAEESGYVSKAATWQVAARQQLPSRREQALSARAGPGAASLRCLCRPCFCLPGLAASPGCHKHRPLCFPRPWELLLCSSCASKGTHRRCSALRTAAEAWECDACAGLGPAPRAQPEPASPSTTSRPGSAAASSSAAASGSESELATSSTSSQAESPASSSSVTTSGSSSRSDLASSSTENQAEAEAGPSLSCPAAESSPQAGRPGPERRPRRSRLFRRPRHPYSRP